MSSSTKPYLHFVNPTAATWTTTTAANSASEHFHRSLPNFSATPLTPLPSLAYELGIAQVLIKDESTRLGLPAFKILGASWATFKAISKIFGLSSGASMSELASTAQRNGVELFAATDGNHGRAVAAMAKWLGIKARIYVPEVMDLGTRALIQSEGAHVYLNVVDGDYDATVRQAFMSAELGPKGILIQDTAFEGYEEIPQWIVEGYSTIFAELDRQVQALTGTDASIVVVPAGVGSLAQSVVLHYKSASRRATLVAVEPDTAACVTTSLIAGYVVPITTQPTIMAGLNCGTVSSVAWPILQGGLDVSISVSDEAAHHAVVDLESLGVYTGPCGAATLAALRLISSWDRDVLGLRSDSVVVLLGTEGVRAYDHPMQV